MSEGNPAFPVGLRRLKEHNMSATSPPMLPGEKGLAANASSYAKNLGRTWEVDGGEWMLVKAAAALTTMGRAVLASATSGGLPTYIVNTTTTAADPYVIGVCKSTQVDLASGDFFLVQRRGYAEVISAAAIAAGAAVGASTTAKKCDDATMTAAGTVGVALESAAGADESVAVRLNM